MTLSSTSNLVHRITKLEQNLDSNFSKTSTNGPVKFNLPLQTYSSASKFSPIKPKISAALQSQFQSANPSIKITLPF